MAGDRSSLWTLAILLALISFGSQAIQWWREHQQATQIQAVLSQYRVQAQDVVMYTTSTCPYCARAKAWLNSNRVPFTECNVETQLSCQREYEHQGAPGVPLMHVNQQWQVGFDPEWLIQSLKVQADSPNAPKSPRP